MADFSDLVTATNAVVDPSTSAADLAQIAQLQPSLRPQVAAHPNVYPALLQWMETQGTIPVSNPAAAPVGQVARRRKTPFVIIAAVVVVAVVASLLIILKPRQAAESGHSSRFNGVSLTTGGGAIAVGCQDSNQHIIIVCAESDANTRSASVATHYGVDGTVGWTKANLGDDTNGQFDAVTVASDGTIIAVGYGTMANTKGNGHAIVVVANSDGSLKWAKAYGGSGFEEFTSVAVESDGTIIAAGLTFSTDGDFPATHGGQDGTGAGTDAVIAAINPADGSLKWAKAYGGSSADEFNGVAIAADNTIVAVGDTQSTDGDFPQSAQDATQSGRDAVMAVINQADGSIQWAKAYGGTWDDLFSSVAVAPDGSLVAAGLAGSEDGDFPGKHIEGTNSFADALIATIDPTSGSLMWASTFGGSATDQFTSVAVTSDGTIIAAGFTQSTDGDFPPARGGKDAVVVSVGSAGTLNWARTYGGTGDDQFNDVAVASDGSMVAVGQSASTDGDFPAVKGQTDAVLAFLTSDGKLR